MARARLCRAVLGHYDLSSVPVGHCDELPPCLCDEANVKLEAAGSSGPEACRERDRNRLKACEDGWGGSSTKARSVTQSVHQNVNHCEKAAEKQGNWIFDVDGFEHVSESQILSAPALFRHCLRGVARSIVWIT